MYRQPPEIEEYLVIWGTIIINRFVGIDAKTKANKWLKDYVKPQYPQNYRILSIDTWILESEK
jgi:hypothetical protein